jgi:hypothetical protein
MDYLGLVNHLDKIKTVLSANGLVSSEIANSINIIAEQAFQAQEQLLAIKAKTRERTRRCRARSATCSATCSATVALQEKSQQNQQPRSATTNGALYISNSKKESIGHTSQKSLFPVLPVTVKPSKRGARIDVNWQLSDADRTFAIQHGVPAADLPRYRDEFVDYWIAVSGVHGCKLDWSSTWRNNVRNRLVPKLSKSSAKQRSSDIPGII